MKKYIIASIISIFPVFILGLCLPIATVLDSDNNKYNNEFFVWCAIILAIGIGILLSTMLSLIKYTNVIDRLDEAEEEVSEKKLQLDTLIKKYNQMILNAKYNGL